MNIKKILFSFGAMLLTLGSLISFSQPAQAVTYNGVTCNISNDSNSAFPNNQLWNCAPAGLGGNIGQYRAVLRQLGANAQSKLTTNNGQFFLFQNRADYMSFCSGGTVIPCVPSVTTSDLGFTTYGPSTNVYSGVFVKYGVGGTVNNPDQNNTEAHEAGHQLDAWYVSATSSSTSFAHDGAIFGTKISKDWMIINALAQCGGGGLFNGQKDTAGNYICVGGALSPSYSGNNENVLKTIWPNIFNDKYEIWAREISNDVTGPPSGSVATGDYYLTKFKCSTAIVHSLTLNGTLPATYPTGC